MGWFAFIVWGGGVYAAHERGWKLFDCLSWPWELGVFIVSKLEDPKP